MICSNNYSTLFEYDITKQTHLSSTKKTSEYLRTDIYIPTTGGEELHGWLYTPNTNLESYPVVIMSHGMGAQKDMGTLSIYLSITFQTNVPITITININ
jgi:dipeptidyl aminopeptidase/acylaminoacyl peptidase